MVLRNVPKMLNTMLADLQSEAWSRGVKLVADASTEIDATLDDGLLAALSELVRTLIAVSRAGASLSFVTDFEPDSSSEGNGRLKIQMSSAKATDGALTKAVEDLRRATRVGKSQLEVHENSNSWAVVLTVQDAKLVNRAGVRRTAVVVDDDVDTQDFLAEVLKSRDFHVISVNDGFDALVVIERHNPDVVLTDILMPNMSGLDLVARIKSFRADLPVVVFSGYRDALVKNFAGLPDKILPKPMSKSEVLAAIDAVLAK